MKNNKIILVNFLGGVPPRTLMQYKSLNKFGYRAQIVHQSNGRDKTCMVSCDLLGINTAFFKRICSINIPKFRGVVGYLEYLLRTAIVLRGSVHHGDVIQLNHPFLLSLVPIIRKKRARIFYDSFEFYSLVYEELGLPGRILSVFCRKIEDYFLPHIDGIICVNSKKSWLKTRLTHLNSKTLELWNFPSLDFADDKIVLDETIRKFQEKKLVVYAGGLKPQKGIRTLPEIVKIVTSENSNVHFLIIGSIESRDDPSDWLSKEGIEGKCSFIPWISPHRLQSYLRASCIGLILLEPRMTYLNLGLGGGRKLFTYMAAGLPVVAPSFGVSWDVVSKESIGFQVDTTRPEKTAIAINTLLRDDPLRIQMSQKAKKLFIDRYNWDKYELKYVRHLNTEI
jgi:glycosyltransferase involved in cell wall biosynthesis